MIKVNREILENMLTFLETDTEECIRPQLAGLFVRGEYVYATQGHIMCRYPALTLSNGQGLEEGAYEILKGESYRLLKREEDHCPKAESLDVICSFEGPHWQASGNRDTYEVTNYQTCLLWFRIAQHGVLINLNYLEHLPRGMKMLVRGEADKFKRLYFIGEGGFEAWIMPMKQEVDLFAKEIEL